METLLVLLGMWLPAILLATLGLLVLYVVMRRQQELRSEPTGKFEASSLGMAAHLAAVLAYALGPLSGVILLLLEKKSHFVRFHAAQSTLFFGSLILLNVLLGFVPLIGWVLGSALTPFGLVLWLILIFHAYAGHWFRLPVVGSAAFEKTLPGDRGSADS